MAESSAKPSTSTTSTSAAGSTIRACAGGKSRKIPGRGVLVYPGDDERENRSFLPFQPVGPDEDFGLLASVPTLSSPLLPFLHKLIRDARSSVHMTIAYFAPSRPIHRGIVQRRPAGQSARCGSCPLPGRTDIKVLRIAAQSFYGEALLDAGVEVYERQGPCCMPRR